jgi:nicotinate-nucleotide--dimethylbenzimidazole phosphoribosyltransferase
LQAIPEGSVVQWTFEYQLGGTLAFLRVFFLRRRLNDEATRSLKRFKQLVESAGIRMDAATVERVSMRPAPSVTERAAIGEATTRVRSTRVEAPHPPAAVPEETQVTLPPEPPEDEPVWLAPAPVLDIGADDLPLLEETGLEPPLAEEDTRPRPPVERPTEPRPPRAELHPEPQPETATTPDTPPLEPEDTVPHAPVELPALFEESANDTLPVAPPTEDFENLIAESPAEPIALAEPPYTAPSKPTVEVEPEVQPEAPVWAEQPEPPRAEEPATSPEIPPQEPAVVEPEPPTALETSPASEPQSIGPSIWEVFGITPPSSQEPAAIQTESEAKPAPVAAVEPAVLKHRLGFHQRAHPARHGNIVRVRQVLRLNGLRARRALRRARRLSRR